MGDICSGFSLAHHVPHILTPAATILQPANPLSRCCNKGAGGDGLTTARWTLGKAHAQHYPCVPTAVVVEALSTHGCRPSQASEEDFNLSSATHAHAWLLGICIKHRQIPDVWGLLYEARCVCLSIARIVPRYTIHNHSMRGKFASDEGEGRGGTEGRAAPF